MPYVKVKTVPRNQQPVHPAPPPVSKVAQTILQLAAHQQVLEAEISQIAADVTYLEDANKRYANIAATTTTAAIGNSSSPFSTPVAAATSSSAMASPVVTTGGSGRSGEMSISSVVGGMSSVHQPKQTQTRGHGKSNNKDAAAIQKCFSGQIAKLKAIKISKEATLKDISQYLQLHQLHGASGDRLLRRVEKELVETHAQS